MLEPSDIRYILFKKKQLMIHYSLLIYFGAIAIRREQCCILYEFYVKLSF